MGKLLLVFLLHTLITIHKTCYNLMIVPNVHNVKVSMCAPLLFVCFHVDHFCVNSFCFKYNLDIFEYESMALKNLIDLIKV